MTKPRRHLPGQVAMLTRRCSEGRFFLRPDKFITGVVGYEIAKAADKYGQHIYAAMAMSNHTHFGVGDTTAKRSDFMRNVMGGIARARNEDLERSGHFWGPGSYCDTVLLDRDAIERKLLYIWLNPVRAGLVERAEDWPGFKILPKHWGETIRVKRPGKYYGPKSSKFVEFTPQPPPGYGDMSLEEVRAHFEALLREEEDKLIEQRREAGKTFLGAKEVCAQKPTDSPDTEDFRSPFAPRFATTDAALMGLATAKYRAFCDCYETRRQRWLKGKKGIKFPCGTVQLRRRAPIRCEEPADDEPALFASG